MFKIKNDKTVKKQYKNNKESKNKITFSFELFCTKSIKTKFFTNYYKTENDFTKSYKLFLNMISDVTGKTENQTRELYSHTHIIDENDENHKKIKKIIKDIHMEKKVEEIDVREFFQLGGPNGFRVIGIKIDTEYYPLFLDPHHLIYPSQKYNDKDIKNFKYDKIEEKVSSENISIFDFNENIPEKCWKCKVLDEYLSK